MLEETLKILKQYTTDEINANTAEEIESNIKTFSLNLKPNNSIVANFALHTPILPLSSESKIIILSICSKFVVFSKIGTKNTPFRLVRELLAYISSRAVKVQIF